LVKKKLHHSRTFRQLAGSSLSMAPRFAFVTVFALCGAGVVIAAMLSN
jgi:hypothetical protein